MFILFVFVSLIIVIGAVGLLAQLGMLPWSSGEREGGVVPHLHELNQGCLLALIIGAIVWFAAWGVVLVLALRFLRSVI